MQKPIWRSLLMMLIVGLGVQGCKTSSPNTSSDVASVSDASFHLGFYQITHLGKRYTQLTVCNTKDKPTTAELTNPKKCIPALVDQHDLPVRYSSTNEAATSKWLSERLKTCEVGENYQANPRDGALVPILCACVGAFLCPAVPIVAVGLGCLGLAESTKNEDAAKAALEFIAKDSCALNGNSSGYTDRKRDFILSIVERIAKSVNARANSAIRWL